jgi:hypothetical protein
MPVSRQTPGVDLALDQRAELHRGSGLSIERSSVLLFPNEPPYEEEQGVEPAADALR